MGVVAELNKLRCLAARVPLKQIANTFLPDA